MNQSILDLTFKMFVNEHFVYLNMFVFNIWEHTAHMLLDDHV